MQPNLTEGNIGSLVRHIAIPASIGFFFNTMFNVVDAYYGGKLGTDALAAMSASFPVFFLIIAISSGISTAASALVGNSLGQKDESLAKKYYLTSIFIGIGISIILTVLGLLTGKALFQSMGLTGQALTYALDYTNVIFYGTIFFVMASILNSYLTAIGDSKTFRNLLIFGCLLNVILDPWFMFGGFGLEPHGLKGIAFSTIFIQFLQCIVIIVKLRKAHILRGFRKFVLDLKIVKEIVLQAIPSSFNMMTVAIGSFIITFFVSKYGKDAVAAYGTAIRIEQIALLPTIGLNIAALSLVGQNNGAKNYTRIREIIKVCLQYGAIVSAFSLLFLIFFGKTFMEIFSKDPNVIKIGVEYLYVASFVFMSYVILFVASSALQGIKKPNRGLSISVMRQIVAPLVIFYFLASKLELPLIWLWLSVLVINWVSAIVLYKMLDKDLKIEEKSLLTF
jgi:putative MATE family efflux protein